MELTPDENVIKLVGTASIKEPLKMGRVYRVIAEAGCYKVEASDNENGTYDKIHKLKLITVEVEDAGRKIPTKAKGKMSQALRWQIIMWMRDNAPELELDDEAAYS